jgi:hypothetical protein
MSAFAYANSAFADDLRVPRVQPGDARVVQILGDRSILVQSGGASFVCQTVEEEQAVIFDDCKPFLLQFVYSQLQLEALAHDADVRLKDIPLDEVDLATAVTLREAGCVLDVGSLELFAEDALAKLGIGYGLNPDLMPFARATVEEIARASFDRLFSVGDLSYLDSRTKVSLKDCA